MEAENAERKLPQHGFQHWYQPGLADLRRGAHHLPLRHLLHGIDVVHPLRAVQVSLMHRVDPQVPGPALRVGSPPLANTHPHRPRLLVADFPNRDTRGPCADCRYAEPKSCTVSGSAHRHTRRIRGIESFASPARSTFHALRPRQLTVRCPLACTGRRTGSDDTRAPSPFRSRGTARSAASPAPGSDPSFSRYTVATLPWPRAADRCIRAPPVSRSPSRKPPSVCCLQICIPRWPPKTPGSAPGSAALRSSC